MIENYSFGKMVVNGVSYNKDLIICGDRVLADWWRRKGHELAVDDILSSVKEFHPSIVVVGTGKWGMVKVLPETRNFLEKREIKIIIEKTDQAWKRYNQFLASEQPMGVFHLTC